MNLSILVKDQIIQSIINFLNEKEDLDLTLEEVKGNQELFSYLMNGSVVEFERGELSVFVDVSECWNSDCYIDVEDYR